MNIGLFDSGVGGLTCLKALVNHFPNLSFHYLGDTARLPYGTKSPETIEKYVLQNIDFLKTKKVDLIISACHSASSAILNQSITSSPIPLYEVITPTCNYLGDSPRKIGLLGTTRTVKSAIYQQKIQKLQPQSQIFSQACPLLVPLVENGWVEDPVTDQILKRYLSPLLKNNIDTLILGCTHYPVLTPAIQRIVGPRVEIIDPSTPLVRSLDALNISANTKKEGPAPKNKIYLTDDSEDFMNLAKQILGLPLFNATAFQEI